ncbi:MAG: endonuclease/exonuclease/phosphatase family protein, partial [Verrucomicrobiota bacterium]
RMNTFRVLQFNMQFGQGWDESDPDNAPVDLERTIAEIRAQQADLIFLQEVERALPDGHQAQPPPNYTRLRAALAGHDGAFAYPRADERELPFGIGLAIFSKTPITGVFQEDIASPPVHFDFFGEDKTPTDRVLLGARTVVGGREVALLNTHLLAFFMLKTNSEEHPEQRAQIERHLRAAEGPMIVCGDFNVRNHASLAAQFRGAGFESTQLDEITWRRMPFVLDHIFHNAALRCERREVIPTAASDHHLLVADFSFA